MIDAVEAVDHITQSAQPGTTRGYVGDLLPKWEGRCRWCSKVAGAGEGIRTLDPNLGNRLLPSEVSTPELNGI